MDLYSAYQPESRFRWPDSFQIALTLLDLPHVDE
jgi:hypothetical protein